MSHNEAVEQLRSQTAAPHPQSALQDLFVFEVALQRAPLLLEGPGTGRGRKKKFLINVEGK